MMESLLFLGASYAVVAALLVALCVNLPGRRSLKIALITLVSVFYGLTWIGHQNTLGWPTSEQMPDQFRVLWITIDEPTKVTQDMGGIYFWVRELDEAGIPQGVPRAYHVPFTAQAAEEAQAALGKMEEGKVMNGTPSRNAVRDEERPEPRANEYEGTDRLAGDDGFRPLFDLKEVAPPTLPPKNV
jgi:hypothetical protein